MSKLCRKCNSTKDDSEFYRDPRPGRGSGGLKSMCKACESAYGANRRRTNSASQEHDRIRYQNPERKLAVRAAAKRWNEANPDGERAHRAVKNALAKGRLQKLPCESCGTANHVHAHHEDYSRPLDIKWLCAKCHHRMHARRLKAQAS